jgi:hypothetical protein
MEDLRCGILADIRAGRIISPKRIKRLIRENKIISKTYEHYLETPHRGDALKMIEGLRAETDALEAMLAASDKVVGDLDEAIYAAGIEDKQALRDMKVEWETHAAGVSPYWTRHIAPGAVDVPFPATGSEG